jgi:hypothetical protein
LYDQPGLLALAKSQARHKHKQARTAWPARPRKRAPSASTAAILEEHTVHFSTHLLRRWAAFMFAALFSLGLAATASAQRGGGDDGNYQILQARYGTAERNVDVTQRLKELARQDRNFRMGNDSFGVDPDPGRVKILRIYTRGRDGQNRTFEYTEGSIVDGNQFTGWGGGNWGHGGWQGGWGDGGPRHPDRDGDDGQYQILEARYGTAARNVDVTPRLKELARQDRQFRMGNDSFGVDPDRGRVKTLRIFTRGRDGRHRMFEYTEGSIVDGNQFTGWRGGNWGHGGWQGGWGDGGPVNDRGGLNIIKASYGAGHRQRDVTDQLRSLARRGGLNITVNNDALGVDPAEGPQCASGPSSGPTPAPRPAAAPSARHAGHQPRHLGLAPSPARHRAPRAPVRRAPASPCAWRLPVCVQHRLHRDHRQLDQVGRRALHRRVDGLALGAGLARAVAAVDLGQVDAPAEQRLDIAGLGRFAGVVHVALDAGKAREVALDVVLGRLRSMPRLDARPKAPMP